MSPLRISNPVEGTARRGLSRLGAGVIVAIGLYGCGASMSPPRDGGSGADDTVPGMNDPSWLTSREKLPPPDTDRLEYDSDKRTLFLYDLPNHEMWVVQLPDEPAGHLVGPQHKLPEGIDISRTLVYYARAGSKVSHPVTVAQIEAGRLAHGSMANGN
jgi:hypothetical protein